MCTPQFGVTVDNFHYRFLIPVIPCLLHMVGAFYMPRSPKYLYLTRGQEKHASQALLFYHGQKASIIQTWSGYSSCMHAIQGGGPMDHSVHRHGYKPVIRTYLLNVWSSTVNRTTISRMQLSGEHQARAERVRGWSAAWDGCGHDASLQQHSSSVAVTSKQCQRDLPKTRTAHQSDLRAVHFGLSRGGWIEPSLHADGAKCVWPSPTCDCLLESYILETHPEALQSAMACHSGHYGLCEQTAGGTWHYKLLQHWYSHQFGWVNRF